MSRFIIPRNIFYGPGCMQELSTLKGYKRAFIVTGGVIPKLGFLTKLEDILKSGGMETYAYTSVENDPSIETVYEGAEKMREFQPDIIVAIGGGSCIDAAKAMWVFYEYPSLKFEDINGIGKVPKLRNKAILVAIPSTSGTGSEVTTFTVISDHKKKLKYPITDYDITPDIAVLDEQIALTMPPTLVAHTGMDALCHAVEAYVALNRSNFTNPLAIHACNVLFGYLTDSYDGDLSARGEVHIAQCLAGMAFTNAQLGITHSLAHKAGAAFNLPHGLCIAIFMPYVIKYNARDRAAMRHYANIARRLGLEGLREMNLVNSLVRGIKDMAAYMGLPSSFKEAGVDEKLLTDNISFIAEQAFLDNCTLTNPRQTNPEDMKTIMACAYYGKPVVI